MRTAVSYTILVTRPLTTFRELIRDPVAHRIRVVHSDNYTYETIAGERSIPQYRDKLIRLPTISSSSNDMQAVASVIHQKVSFTVALQYSPTNIFPFMLRLLPSAFKEGYLINRTIEQQSIIML